MLASRRARTCASYSLRLASAARRCSSASVTKPLPHAAACTPTASPPLPAPLPVPEMTLPAVQDCPPRLRPLLPLCARCACCCCCCCSSAAEPASLTEAAEEAPGFLPLLAELLRPLPASDCCCCCCWYLRLVRPVGGDTNGSLAVTDAPPLPLLPLPPAAPPLPACIPGMADCTL